MQQPLLQLDGLQLPASTTLQVPAEQVPPLQEWQLAPPLPQKELFSWLTGTQMLCTQQPAQVCGQEPASGPPASEPPPSGAPASGCVPPSPGLPPSPEPPTHASETQELPLRQMLHTPPPVPHSVADSCCGATQTLPEQQPLQLEGPQEPPWLPGVTQEPSWQTWFAAHEEQTPPLEPQALPTLPGAHNPVGSQQPRQFAGPHRVGEEQLSPTAATRAMLHKKALMTGWTPQISLKCKRIWVPRLRSG
jgi:hypothetical protein